MNRSTYRIILVITTVITAAIHLFLGVRFISDGFFGVLFVLNGLGFVSLLYLVLRPFPFLAGREALLHYSLMGFSAITILAWLVLTEEYFDPVALFTKIDEVIVIVVAWLHLRAGQEQTATS